MKENLLEIVLNWIQRPKVFTSFNSFPLRENFRKPDQTTSQNQAENKIVIFVTIQVQVQVSPSRVQV